MSLALSLVKMDVLSYSCLSFQQATLRLVIEFLWLALEILNGILEPTKLFIAESIKGVRTCGYGEASLKLVCNLLVSAQKLIETNTFKSPLEHIIGTEIHPAQVGFGICF